MRLYKILTAGFVVVAQFLYSACSSPKVLKKTTADSTHISIDSVVQEVDSSKADTASIILTKVMDDVEDAIKKGKSPEKALRTLDMAYFAADLSKKLNIPVNDITMLGPKIGTDSAGLRKIDWCIDVRIGAYTVRKNSSFEKGDVIVKSNLDYIWINDKQRNRLRERAALFVDSLGDGDGFMNEGEGDYLIESSVKRHGIE